MVKFIKFCVRNLILYIYIYIYVKDIMEKPSKYNLPYKTVSTYDVLDLFIGRITRSSARNLEGFKQKY